MSFAKEVEARIDANRADECLKASAGSFMLASLRPKYSYNFSWMGRPIIQYPQDMIAMQEIIWDVRPDLIIETGIAHGGSLVYYASLLELRAACDGNQGEVLGIDIEIRPHNRKAIEEHPMKKRITMIEGSSTASDIVDQVWELARDKESVLVCLDSNHTHDHVLAELEAYAPLVTVGSYCVVFDTVVEDMPENSFPDRSWSKGDNPKTAVWEYLKNHSEFEIDRNIEHKLLITVAPEGYLKRVK
jgi:cephalosporin hydroxylase